MRAYSEPPARAAGRLYDNVPRLGKELAGLGDVIRSKCDVLGHRQSRLFQEPRDDRLIGRHTERGRPVQIGILMLDSRANVLAGDLQETAVKRSDPRTDRPGGLAPQAVIHTVAGYLTQPSPPLVLVEDSRRRSRADRTSNIKADHECTSRRSHGLC